MILYVPLLILSDVDCSLSQGMRGDSEAIEGDVVTRLHILFLNFIITNVGAVPIDSRDHFAASVDMHFEGALSATGRVFPTTVTPFVLTLAANLSPLGARG